MATILGLPEFDIEWIDINPSLKEFRFQVKLTTEQYRVLKSSCIIELPDHMISISDGQWILVASKIAKLVKLVVYNHEYTGEFLVRDLQQYGRQEDTSSS